MAREAVNIDDSPETRSALFAALQRTPAIRDRIYPPGGTSAAGGERQWIAISSDGSTIAIGDAGPSVEVIDAVNRVPIGAVDVGSGTEHAAFSPDGKTLAVVTSTGDLVSIDVSTRSERGRVSAEGLVDAIAFDPATASSSPLSTTRAGGSSSCPATRSRWSPRVEGSSRRGGIGWDSRTSVLRSPCSPWRSRRTAAGSATRTNGPTLLWNPRLTVVRRYAIGAQAVAVSPDGDVAALIENGDDDYTGTVSFLNLRTGDLRTASGGHQGPRRPRTKQSVRPSPQTDAPSSRSGTTRGSSSGT